MANEKRLIDANVFWESVSTDYWEHFTQCHTTDQIDLMEMVEANLAEQPTVDAVEVVHGEWIRCLDVDDVEYIECPICGGEFYDGDNDTFDKPYNYCPNCCAKMDGDGNT